MYRPFLHIHNGMNLIFHTESFSGLRSCSLDDIFQVHSTDEGRDKLPLVTVGKRKELFDLICHDLRNSSDLQIENDGESDESNIAIADQIEGIMEKEDKVEEIVDTDKTEDSSSVSTATSSGRLFIDDLYFVCKDGNIDCIHSKAYSWSLNKIATEVTRITIILDHNFLILNS